jgi:hypothetical protein
MNSYDQLLEHEGPGINIAGVWELDCPDIMLDWLHDETHQPKIICAAACVI